MQLNPIALNGKRGLHKAGSDRHVIPGDCALRQHDHLVDRRIEIKVIFSRRRLLDVITDAVDDVAGPIRIAHNTDERFPDLTQVRRLHAQKIRAARALLRALAIGCVIS